MSALRSSSEGLSPSPALGGPPSTSRGVHRRVTALAVAAKMVAKLLRVGSAQQSSPMASPAWIGSRTSKVVVVLAGGFSAGPVPAPVRVSLLPGRVMRSAAGKVSVPTLIRQRTTTPSLGASTPPGAWLDGGRAEFATVQSGAQPRPLSGEPARLLPIVVAAKPLAAPATANPAAASPEAIRSLLRIIPSP